MKRFFLMLYHMWFVVAMLLLAVALFFILKYS